MVEAAIAKKEEQEPVGVPREAEGRAKVGRFPADSGRLQPTRRASEVASFRFFSLPVDDWLALITQRSEVQILPPQPRTFEPGSCRAFLLGFEPSSPSRGTTRRFGAPTAAKPRTRGANASRRPAIIASPATNQIKGLGREA